MFHAKTSQTHDIPTKLRFRIPWAWKGHVVPTKSKYAVSKSSAYLRGIWLKTKKNQTAKFEFLWFEEIFVDLMQFKTNDRSPNGNKLQTSSTSRSW